MNGFDFSLTLENIRSVSMMLLDILIVWLILYYVLHLVRANSKTSQIFKGILFVIIVDALSKFLGLRTLEYFADMFINWGFLALIIIFQPELRGVLEKLGKTSVFRRMSGMDENARVNLVDQIVTALMLLSKDKTGALISIERTPQSLDDFVATGTKLNADVTAEILTSIFVTTTPLHDGAVIIQGDRIACASAYFPPTNMELPGRYGARHRAAIGISEITDAVTIIVSEETGRISITEGGRIRTVDEKQLREYLLKVICGENREEKSSDNVQRKSSLVEKLALRRQTEEKNGDSSVKKGFLARLTDPEHPESEEEKLEELHHEAERIKLPQNHKHDRPVPSYPQRSRPAMKKAMPQPPARISPVAVSTTHEPQTPASEDEKDAAEKNSEGDSQ